MRFGSSRAGNLPRRPGGGASGWARCAAASLGLALLPFMALSLVTEAPASASGPTVFAYVGGGARPPAQLPA